MGSVSTDSLFPGWDDWHDSRRAFLRQLLFQHDADRVVVLRLRAILSRSSYLCALYFAGQNQMGGMGVSRVLIARIFF